MLPGLEPLFQEIADSMVAAIPEEWSTARVEAIYFSDSSVYEAEYTRKADGVPRDFETPEQCLDAFDCAATTIYRRRTAGVGEGRV